MKRFDLQTVLPKVMLYGVLAAAALLLVGGVVYLYHHGGDPVRDHVFTGEPRDLRDPASIVVSAFEGHTLSIIQAGVLLLLLNPILRVALALFGYALQRNVLYVFVSLTVLTVLLYSFLA